MGITTEIMRELPWIRSKISVTANSFGLRFGRLELSNSIQWALTRRHNESGRAAFPPLYHGRGLRRHIRHCPQAEWTALRANRKRPASRAIAHDSWSQFQAAVV